MHQTSSNIVKLRAEVERLTKSVDTMTEQFSLLTQKIFASTLAPNNPTAEQTAIPITINIPQPTATYNNTDTESQNNPQYNTTTMPILPPNVDTTSTTTYHKNSTFTTATTHNTIPITAKMPKQITDFFNNISSPLRSYKGI